MPYTFQKIKWCKCINNPITDVYGDIARADAIKITARKQPTGIIIKNNHGRELTAKSIYYVDPKYEKNASLINRLDTLDGEIIESVYIMVDYKGQPTMYRFITV